MIRIIPVIHVLALLLIIISLFMLFPMGIALFERDFISVRAFAISIATTIAVCIAAFWASKKQWQTNHLRPREGFLLVTASWVFASGVGALPFVFSQAIPSYTDAYFETISGFTTTGASILSVIETLPRSMLFWRSLTHWLGGMGIVVLTVAVLPFLGAGGVQLVRAEAPGPTLDKIAPKITQTAKILWFIYLGLTALETALLMLGGMNLFDALTHSFGTLATGGFSPKNTSVGHYQSAYIDVVITVFMVMAGTNFGLFHKMLKGNFRNVFKNTELKVYLIIFLAAVLISAFSLREVYESFGQALRFAGFQVASIITTTGYATANFDGWPTIAKTVLFLLMFIGGCSGSTGGGIKVVRIAGLFKQAFNEMRYMVHPRGVFHIRLDGNTVNKAFLYSISGFIILYLFLLLLVTMVVAVFGDDLLTAFSTALATVGNIGPGFARVGPTMNYAFYHPFVKWVLSAAMLAGRLEVYTVLILFNPWFWARR